MKTTIMLSILALSTSAASHAGPMLTLNPASGSIQGLPGDNVGWGFTLTSDSASWTSVVTSSLIDETNPALGFYTDFAGLWGGPVDGVLAPDTAPWTMAFDLVNQTGIGVFEIDPGAALGSVDKGLIDLNYETFSADPNVCTSCATGFGDLQVAFQVEAAAPEPGAGWLMLTPLSLLWFRRATVQRRLGRSLS